MLRPIQRTAIISTLRALVVSGLVVLSLVVLSTVALYNHYSLKYSGGSVALFCDQSTLEGCTSAANSFWSELFFEIPVAAVSTALYLLLLVFELFFKKNLFLKASLYVIAGAGSLFYTVLSFTALRSPCKLCLAIHGLVLALLILAKPLRDLRAFSTKKNLVLLSLILVAISTLAASIHFIGLPILMKKKNWSNSHETKKSEWTKDPAPSLKFEHPTLQLGDPTRPSIQMTMVIDFTCPYCREHLFELTRALEAQKKSAQIDFVIIPRSQCTVSSDSDDCRTARVGICQFKRQKFETYLRKIYQTPGYEMLSLDLLLQSEESDIQQRAELSKCVHDPETVALINKYQSFGSLHSLRRTPTTWINGYKFSGRLQWKHWVKVFE